MAHRSTEGSAINAWSFFMGQLPFWVGPGNRGARFAQAETQLPEQALALSHSHADPILPLDPGGQSLAVPQIAPQTQRAWHLPQGGVDVLPLFLAQPSRPLWDWWHFP